MSEPIMRGCYVLYDTVAEECGPLFDAKNDAIAVRLSLLLLLMHPLFVIYGYLKLQRLIQLLDK